MAGLEPAISCSQSTRNTNFPTPSYFNELFLWCGAGSNRRHQDFQSCALPTELPHPMPKKNPILFENRIFYMFSFYISTLTKYYIFLILALAIIPFCNSHLYKRVIALRHKVNGDISEEFFHFFVNLSFIYLSELLILCKTK